MNKLLGLKLTNLNKEILKCGFPLIKEEKYLNLLEKLGLEIEIVEEISKIDYSCEKKVRIDRNNREN